MSALDPKRKNKIVKNIVLNVIAILFFSGIIFLFILPMYDSIGSKIESLNELNSKLSDIKRNGTDGKGYEALVLKYQKIKKQSSEKTDYANLDRILKKTNPNQDYLEWVKMENASGSIDDAIIENNSRIIGNIIPMYSAGNKEAVEPFIKNKISLKQLVSFVEQKLLKENNIESYSPIGFSNLSFSPNQWASTIGQYKISFDIDAANKDIVSLVTMIQKSGELPLRDGKLVDQDTESNVPSPEYSTLSNLLMNINNIDVADPLDPNDPEKRNKATLSLNFYVRGQSYSDYIEIRNALMERVKKLKDGIMKTGNMCNNGIVNELCKNANIFASSNIVKNLIPDITAIDKQLQDSVKNSSVRDVATEFSELFRIFTSVSSVEAIFKKNFDIVESARKWSDSNTES